ncbi:hypothetical protein Btru_048174 [Bulinus truncatus]|nr:hypothetical protein Btru_048174 [Bulinus truncatus]
MGRTLSKLYKDEVSDAPEPAPRCPPDLESPLSDVQYNQELKEAISDTFVSYVIPLNILHVFHKYNRRVLVRQDLDFVKAQASHLGEVVGSRALLDRLAIYEDWFHCLLQSLRDSDVMLGHVAYQMENIREALDERILEQDETNDNQDQESQLPCQQPHRAQLKEAMKLKVKLEHMTKEYNQEREMRVKYEEELHNLRTDSVTTERDQTLVADEDPLHQLRTDLESVNAENERLQKQLMKEREKVKNMKLEILEKQSHLDGQRSIADNKKKNKDRKLRPLLCLGQVKQRSKRKNKENLSADVNKSKNKENHHSETTNKDEPN